VRTLLIAAGAAQQRTSLEHALLHAHTSTLTRALRLNQWGLFLHGAAAARGAGSAHLGHADGRALPGSATVVAHLLAPAPHAPPRATLHTLDPATSQSEAWPLAAPMNGVGRSGVPGTLPPFCGAAGPVRLLAVLCPREFVVR